MVATSASTLFDCSSANLGMSFPAVVSFDLSASTTMLTILLQAVSDLVCGLWITELEDWIIVERPVLRILILAPNLLTLHAKDLHANASRCRDAVWHNLRSERRVSHDDIINTRSLEHALAEVVWQVIMNDELAHYAALRLQMGASKAVHVLIEVHHLEAIELIRDLLDLLGLARLLDFDALSIPIV